MKTHKLFEFIYDFKTVLEQIDLDLLKFCRIDIVCFAKIPRFEHRFEAECREGIKTLDKLGGEGLIKNTFVV